MSLSPLDPSRIGDDSHLLYARRCAACGGVMRCKGLIEYRINRGYAGRDYTFVCEKCGQRVTELNAARVLYVGAIVVIGGGLGITLVTYGVEMLVKTITHGPGGNDLSAVILVLVIFLGLGTPFLLLMLWTAKLFISDWLRLRRNPVISAMEMPDDSPY